MLVSTKNSLTTQRKIKIYEKLSRNKKIIINARHCCFNTRLDDFFSLFVNESSK